MLYSDVGCPASGYGAAKHVATQACSHTSQCNGVLVSVLSFDDDAYPLFLRAQARQDNSGTTVRCSARCFQQ